MTTINFPSSTAINSNGGCFYHGGLQNLDLSTPQFCDLAGSDRARYETAAADVLLDAAEPAARPTKRKRKRKLWFAPDGIGHQQDEHRPGAVCRPCRQPDQVKEGTYKGVEHPNKRAINSACLEI